MWSCFKSLTPEPENENFLLNGALILERSIASCDGKTNPLCAYSEEQLKKATNNYNGLQILRDDYNYTLYSGVLDDDHTVFIKKFKEYDTVFAEQAINEIVIASQMNKHNKVLNLLGYCLESKVPILVFESATNGVLSDHIFEKFTEDSSNHLMLPWETRLRISMEIAYAATYLYMSKSNPIIHRQITSSNVFLDEHLGAKLFDFGLSVCLPSGKTHVEAEVVGEFGYTAPESVATGRYTEKSDVFSLGAMLFELLTGKKAREILMEILEIALRCVKENPEERPIMKEVAEELRRITRFQ